MTALPPYNPRSRSFFRRYPLFRILITNICIGSMAAAFLVAILLYTDTLGLWTLVSGDSNPVLPVLLLFFSIALTFSSIAMGIAIMTMPYDDDDDDHKGGTKSPVFGLSSMRLAPIPVSTDQRRS